MRRLSFIAILLLFLSCNFDTPIQFTQDALAENVTSLDGSVLKLGDVIEQYKGKKILIDVWASWCSDCIKGLPDVKQLQLNYPDVEFLFLSVDINETRWERSIQKYEIEGHHYFLPKGQKGAFGDFLNSNWTPRYMVVDEAGTITLFKAKKASDSRINEALN